MIEQIKFFAVTHNGDIFSSKEFLRQFVGEISKFLPVSLIAVQHPNAINLDIKLERVEDYPHLYLRMDSPQHFIQGDTLYINTWVGHFLTAATHCIANQVPMWQYIADVIKHYTDISIEVSTDPTRYVPTIQLYEGVPTLDSSQCYVLFCNNEALSGQSDVGDLTEVIKSLATKHSHLKFICTQRIPVSLDNVIFTDDLCDREKLQCDLSHIGLLSNQCRMIVSKSTGPGTFCMTRDNFFSSDKTIVSLSKYPENLFWHNIPQVQARTLWHSDPSELEICDLLDRELGVL